MRPGARRAYVEALRGLSRTASEMAQRMEVSELPDLRRVSVGWGSNGCEVDIGGTYVFQMARDEPHVVSIVRALVWGLFESSRASDNPSDPVALARIHAVLQGIVDDVGKHTYQPPCTRCGGLRHICVACDSECKVPFYNPNLIDVHVHDRTQALCPECSAWLAPRAPR